MTSPQPEGPWEPARHHLVSINREHPITQEMSRGLEALCQKWGTKTRCVLDYTTEGSLLSRHQEAAEAERAACLKSSGLSGPKSPGLPPSRPIAARRKPHGRRARSKLSLRRRRPDTERRKGGVRSERRRVGKPGEELLT